MYIYISYVLICDVCVLDHDFVRRYKYVHASTHTNRPTHTYTHTYTHFLYPVNTQETRKKKKIVQKRINAPTRVLV